jgi:aminoglycoside phosphotransferase (APT) family kinase protein
MAEPAHQPELAVLSALVGAEVVAAERSPWGFENRTDIVRLADGRRLVVQRITRRSVARQRLLLAAAVPPLLAAVGIRAPRLLGGDSEGEPPFAIREYLPGEPANLLLGAEESAVALARVMGALLPLLARAPHAGAPLPDLWADPARLAAESLRRLEACRPLIDAATSAALAGAVEQLPALFAGRAPVFAHGDYCPVNALALAPGRPLEEPREATAAAPRSSESSPPLIGLLDFDEARLADPLFDAAWWSWVVRFHHPDRWGGAWPAFLEAAGVADDGPTDGRVRALQLMRLLEALDEAREHTPSAAPGWAGRLAVTASWR